MGISAHRKRIDDMDRQLVRLLNRRIRTAIQIGHMKKANGLPLRDLLREKEILRRARRSNAGPLGPRAVETLFRWLLAESRRQASRALAARQARSRDAAGGPL